MNAEPQQPVTINDQSRWAGKRWLLLPRWTLMLLLIILALTASILVWSHQRKRTHETVDSGAESCRRNFDEIYRAIRQYASQHQRTYPGSLEMLVSSGYLDPRFLVCQETADTPATAPTDLGLLAEYSRGNHDSYLYFGRGLTFDSDVHGSVLVAERQSPHQNGTAVILLDDGAVECVPGQESRRLIARALEMMTHAPDLPGR